MSMPEAVRLNVCTEPVPAAGMPGIGQGRSLVTVDLYRRFKTMQGFAVSARTGVSGHGAEVELAVEQELGLESKAAVTAYGLEAFLQLCEEKALRHAAVRMAIADRLGCQADQGQPYRTTRASYIESGWWSLRQLSDAGSLVRDRRVTSYCPRCQTPLAEQDLRRPGGYRQGESTEVVVRLPIGEQDSSEPGRGADPRLNGADLLVWTAAPWTLPAGTGIAVRKDATYVIARRAGHGDRAVVAQDRLYRVLGEGWHPITSLTGSDLVGVRYRPAYEPDAASGRRFEVVAELADASGRPPRTGLPRGTDQPETGLPRGIGLPPGTGLVHLAPAYGLGQPGPDPRPIDPIGPDGRFDATVPALRGLFFADADPVIVADLSDRDLLVAARRRQVSRPHCPHCGTPLLRRALQAWHLDLSAISLAPAQAARGRSQDWVISRSTYWGTPLPFWECPGGHLTCVSSLAELSELAGTDLLDVNPHYPALAGIRIPCRTCRSEAAWVRQTIDPRYDCAAMSFAQHGAPLRHAAQFTADFPAWLAADNPEPTSTWLDDLNVVTASTMGTAPARSAIRHGRVLDECGQPMLGGQGSLIDPLSVIDRHGPDALRWYFASCPPEATIKFSDATIRNSARKLLLTYWHTAMFFRTHAQAIQPDAALAVQARPLADRWLLSELQAVVSDVTAALETFRPDLATHRLAGFVRDLSRWYIRLLRPRLTSPPDRATAASRTSPATLATPATPATQPTGRTSPATLATPATPATQPTGRTSPAIPAMSATQATDPTTPTTPAGVQASPGAGLATLGAGLDVLTRLIAPIAPMLAERVWSSIHGDDAAPSVHLAPWPRPLGSLLDDRLNEQMVRARRLVALGRAARAAAHIEARQPLAAAWIAPAGRLELDEEFADLIAAELNVKRVEISADQASQPSRPAREPAVATGPAGTIMLDVAITAQLRGEGRTRWAIREIQAARKHHRFPVGSQIMLGWTTDDPDLAAILEEHAPAIATAVRAASYHPMAATEAASDGYQPQPSHKLATTFWLRPLP
jgi:isoleucyl-tRNA synthetase